MAWSFVMVALTCNGATSPKQKMPRQIILVIIFIFCPSVDFHRVFQIAKTVSSPTFLICEKHCDAHFQRGIVIAKTTWSVSAEKAWRIELSCFCAKNRNLVGVAASNGNGRAKCNAQNFGTFFKTLQMQRE